MNQLLIEQLRTLTESSKDGAEDALAEMELLMQGSQYEISKTLVERLVAVKSELTKERR